MLVKRICFFFKLEFRDEDNIVLVLEELLIRGK